MIKNRLSAFIALMFLTLCVNTSAKADAQISVAYTQEEDRIEPNEATMSSVVNYTFLVTKDHQIKISYATNSAFSGGNFGVIAAPHGGHSVTGLRTVQRARIEKDKLIFAEFHESYKKIITVTIRNSACDAAVTYALMPNHKYFEAKEEKSGLPVKGRDFHAQQCNMPDRGIRGVTIWTMLG